MGKLIAIEGTDGSGKETQSRILLGRLAAAGVSARKLDFPRYGKESSALVRLYLGGAFGKKPDDVNAYAASTFFAVDRYASMKEDWGGFYAAGGLLVSDRYTTSNAVHQAPKLPEGERDAFVSWLFDFEYRLLGLPAPDLVVYLDMPVEVTRAMMRRRSAETGAAADIHEADAEYLERCRAFALGEAAKLGWSVIGCARGGEPRSEAEIGDEVFGAVSALLTERP